jgi:hypothetical protein
MFLSECPSEFDDSLHSRDLSLDIWIEVFLTNSWEVEKMNGAFVLLTGWQKLL